MKSKNCKYFSSDGDKWQSDICSLTGEEYPQCEDCLVGEKK
jgi:hypothetical protein